jgi:hypothetical protein
MFGVVLEALDAETADAVLAQPFTAAQRSRLSS